MDKRPKTSDLKKPRMWKGKQWWYCSPETGGKCEGAYRRHKPSECWGGFKKRSIEKDIGTSSSKTKDAQKGAKELKLSKAMPAIVDSEDDHTNHQSFDDEGYHSS